MKVTKIQKAILEIFKTDSKTTKYLEKRMDLTDDEFLAAAKKQRPSNRKLKDFEDGLRKHREKLPTVEDIKNSKTEVVEPKNTFKATKVEQATTVQDDIFEIFKTDSKTTKYLKKRTDFTDDAFIEAAKKQRPSNVKLKEYIANREEMLADIEEMERAERDPLDVYNEWKEDQNDKFYDQFDEEQTEEEELDGTEVDTSELDAAFNDGQMPGAEYTETEEESKASWDAVDAELKDEAVIAKMAKDKVEEKEPEELNIFQKTYNKLASIFQNDKGTKKKIERAATQEISADDLLEVAKKARPNNAKLRELTSEYESLKEATSMEKFIEADEVDDATEEDLEAVAEDIQARQEKKEEPSGKRIRIPHSPIDDDDDDEETVQIIEEVAGKYKDKKITPDMVPMPDVVPSLREIFKNDKGTLKAINKNADKLSDDDMIELCLSKRPKNVKLKTLMAEISLAREAIEEAEDEIDSQKVFEGSDDAVSDYQAKRMMKVDSIPYVMNDKKNITMFIGGEMEVLNDEHPNFNRIVKCLEDEKWDDVFPLLDLRAGIASLVYKQLEFKNDTLYHNGKELHGALVDFIINMVQSGERDVQPFMRFLHKLLKNPSERAQQELYGFLASGKIPINDKGNILTYKRIREDWTDCHSGKFDNSVGNVVSMERSQVVDNQNITCAQGLHVCSYSYLSSFGGGRTVICEVNPKDVVSIPTDYKNAKMRCCKYTVLKEVENNGPDVLSEKPIYW